jgi:2'-5' RNA ligase
MRKKKEYGMPYSVELYLNETSEKAIRAIWEAIDRAGISNYLPEAGARPHISLTCYDEGIDIRHFTEALGDFAASWKQIHITFSYIGVFPKGIVFLGHTVTGRLIETHKAFHHRLSSWLDESFELYLPGTWIPHCSVAMNLPPEDVAAAVDIVRTFPLPMDAVLERVALVSYPPTKELGVFPLQE